MDFKQRRNMVTVCTLTKLSLGALKGVDWERA